MSAITRIEDRPIVWEAPPETDDGIQNTPWMRRLREVMARPGSWARVDTCGAQRAWELAARLRKREVRVPLGRWEFKAGQLEAPEGDLTHGVWARYLGKDGAPADVCSSSPAPRPCTCLGTCKGAEGLGPGWTCALELGAGAAAPPETPGRPRAETGGTGAPPAAAGAPEPNALPHSTVDRPAAAAPAPRPRARAAAPAPARAPRPTSLPCQACGKPLAVKPRGPLPRFCKVGGTRAACTERPGRGRRPAEATPDEEPAALSPEELRRAESRARIDNMLVMAEKPGGALPRSTLLERFESRREGRR